MGLSRNLIWNLIVTHAVSWWRGISLASSLQDNQSAAWGIQKIRGKNQGPKQIKYWRQRDNWLAMPAQHCTATGAVRSQEWIMMAMMSSRSGHSWKLHLQQKAIEVCLAAIWLYFIWQLACRAASWRRKKKNPTAFREYLHLLTYELALSDRDCDKVKRNHWKAGPVQAENARKD